MSSQQQPVPGRVYLDNTALVDVADPTERRYAAAQQFLQVFQRHRHTGLLQLITSTWTMTECHGILYGKELSRRGITIPGRAGINPRNYLPPDRPSLNAAHRQVVALLQTLQTTTDFQLWPDQSRDAVPTYQLAMQIGREAGIWPTDSMHLALALESDCTMLVTDDRDFLDKIDCCHASLIQPYRRQQFSQLQSPPPFQAHGLIPTTCRIPGQGRRRPSAMQALITLGF
jgi:hypothetical protein